MITQDAFRAGLLDPERPEPKGLYGIGNAPAGKRYDVYRNNVTHSLVGAMRTAFPLVRKLIGALKFDTLAPLYVRQHPPSSPLLMFYGASFPEFLAGFAPLSQIGYLADAARLDVELRASYHASDAIPLTAKALQALPAETLLDATISLAPATRILRSSWPLYDIWRFNFEPDAPRPRNIAQDIVVTRPKFDPAPHALPKGAATWLETLGSGTPFGAAHEKTLTVCPDFDLGAALTLALQTGALVLQNHKDPT